MRTDEESAWEFLNLRVPVCMDLPQPNHRHVPEKKPYPLLLNPQICPPGKAQGAPWAPWSNLTIFSWENHGTLELIIVIYIVGNSTGKSWFNQVYCRKRPVIFASPWGMGWSSIYLATLATVWPWHSWVPKKSLKRPGCELFMNSETHKPEFPSNWDASPAQNPCCFGQFLG